MPTLRQAKFVDKTCKNLQENTGKALQEIAKESGYKSYAKHPGEIMKSKGVLELFAKRGITPELLSEKYRELLSLPLKEQSISADTRRKTLEDLSRRIIDNKEERIKPQIQFIEKFLNIRELKYNRPKGITTEIIEEQEG